MKLFKSVISQCFVVSAISSLLALSSCDDLVYDDLTDCKMYVQFNYDYNMLYTNAFSKQVKEVSLFFFDENGHYIKSQSESGDVLRKDGYKMEVSLPSEHRYTMLSWCGHLNDYELTKLTEGVSSPQDLELRLKDYDKTSLVNNSNIDDLWYGKPVEFDRVIGSQTETVNLVRNTNRIRIIMKDINCEEEDAKPISDFDIQFKSENSTYDYLNNLLPSPLISYEPYYTSGDSYESMVAELNTMRLLADKECKLYIKNKDNGLSIFGESMPSINMIKYLLLTKMEGYDISDQEYLDRQYDWNVIIYYTDKGSNYMALKIVINSWTVWIQEVEV